MRTISRTGPRAARAAFLMAAAALQAGCGSTEPVERIPTPVTAVGVRSRVEARAVRYSADIEANRQVALAFKASGYVEEILKVRGADGRARPVQAGDAVARGAVLARLQQRDYVERREQARSSQAEARAGHEKARADFERAEALFRSGSLTKPDHDAARASHEAARARLDAATAQLQQAEIALEDTELRAPMKAIVLGRKIEEGSLAAAGTVGFVLADVSSVKATFGVPDQVVGWLKPGDALTVTAEFLGGAEFAGRVTAVSPSADSQSRVFEVEVTIPNPREVLKVGMIATVAVAPPGGAASGRAGPVPVVPVGAIVRSPRDAAGYAVFLVEGEEGAAVARAREVTLGEVYGNDVAITSGLEPGDRVVVTGASLLSDGERVRVIP